MFLVFFMYFLFASTFTLGKAALSYVTPFLFTGIRMMCGGVILLGYSFLRKKCFISRRDIYLFVQIMVFHIFLAYTLEFWALETVTSAKACLLYNLSPFITALFSYCLFAEKLNVRQLCGLFIGFVGFLPILLAQTPLEQISGHLGFLSWPEIALICSVTSSAYGWMTMKKLTHKGYPFVLVNGIGMTGGGLLALLLSYFTEGPVRLKMTAVMMPVVAQHYGVFIEHMLALGMYSLTLILIANIIGYNLYAHLLSRYSATFLSFAGFMTPLFAAILGWIFLGETVTWHFFATMLLVMGGLYLFHEKKEIEFEEQGL